MGDFLLDEWLHSQQIILGYIWGDGGIIALHRALARTHSEYFTGFYQKLWGLLCTYHSKTRGVLNLTRLRELLRDRNVSEEHIFKVEEILDLCQTSVYDVDMAGFEWMLGRLEEIYNQIQFKQIIEESSIKMEKEGYAVARNHVFAELSSLGSGDLDLAPEGLLVDEISDFITEVGSAKESRIKQAVETGYAGLDAEILGLRSGDTMLIAGWTECGKTSLSLNIAVHAAIVQKKNVVMVTTETVRSQLRRRIFSRISKLPQFKVSIPSKILKAGGLTAEQRATLLDMKKFLREEKHGALMIVQAPAKATMSWLRGRLLQYESMFHVDLLILDDIRNMSPETRRRQDYEEISSLLRGMKTVARTHAGRGIPIISPYHVSREAYKEAKLNGGHYSLAGLSSSSEAEKITDIIASLWRPEDSLDINYEFLKVRDGEKGRICRLRADFAHQYLYEINIDGELDLDGDDD